MTEQPAEAGNTVTRRVVRDWDEEEVSVVSLLANVGSQSYQRLCTNNTDIFNAVLPLGSLLSECRQ